MFLTRFLYREWHPQSLAGGPKNRFLRVAPGVGQNCPGPFHDTLPGPFCADYNDSGAHFSVSNTEFEGGDDEHGRGKGPFLVK